jgi:purine-binding chemotaxis protein CheW
MDLKQRLGHPRQKYQLNDAVIVLASAERTMGMIVNGVREVREINEADIQPPAFDHLVGGEAKAGDELFMLVNHDKILSEMGEGQHRVAEQAYFCPQATPEERSAFHKRAHDLAGEPGKKEAAASRTIAVFDLNGEYFGVEASAVREFAEIHNLTPAPCCPAQIVGNLNLRGSILTLLDVRSLLDLPVGEIKGSSRIMVWAGGLSAGILVDEISDMVQLGEAELLPLPSAIEKAGSRYVRGTAPYAGKTMTIIDLPKLLADEQLVVDRQV